MHAKHVIRKQKKVNLPTGGRPDDFYKNPEAYGGKNTLIKVDETHIDQLYQDLLPSRLFQFGTDESVALASKLYLGAEVQLLLLQTHGLCGEP